MIPRFHFDRPQSLDEAFECFGVDPGDSAYLAGGTELLQVMKMGLATIGRLIDLKAIEALRGIDVEPTGTLVIGALTTHREIERSSAVRRHTPSLAELAQRVANVRVRSTGTLGGNLAFAEPHSDPATLLLVCDASIGLAGPSGTRWLPVEGFVLGPLMTAREPDEIVIAIRVPPPRPGTTRAYERLAFTERPLVSVAVSATVVDGSIGDVAVAVGSITDIPTRLADAGPALIGVAVERVPETIGSIATSLAGGIAAFDDLGGSAEYKRHLAALLIERAVHRAVGRRRERGVSAA